MVPPQVPCALDSLNTVGRLLHPVLTPGLLCAPGSVANAVESCQSAAISPSHPPTLPSRHASCGEFSSLAPLYWRPLRTRAVPKRTDYYYSLLRDRLPILGLVTANRRRLQPTAVSWRLTAVSCSSGSISVGALVDPQITSAGKKIGQGPPLLRTPPARCWGRLPPHRYLPL